MECLRPGYRNNQLSPRILAIWTKGLSLLLLLSSSSTTGLLAFATALLAFIAVLLFRSVLLALLRVGTTVALAFSSFGCFFAGLSNLERPREAPYKVYPPKFQNFALKGAKISG
jgi:hypothetical protein